MRPRPPWPSTSATTIVAIVLASIVVTSSIAAGALTGIGPLTPTRADDTDIQQSNTTAATCALGTAGSETSSTANENLSVSTWTAPASAEGEFQTGADIRNAIETGRLTPDHAGANRYEEDSVAIGDVVVHRIQLNGSATGLLDRLDAQNEGSPTQNFRAIVQRDDSGVEFRYIGPTACPPRLALNASIANDSFRVFPDREYDTLYIVVDHEELRFELGGSGPVADRWNWGRHAVSLTLRESSGLVPKNTSSEEDYDVEHQYVQLDTEHDSLVRFSPAPNQTVRGSASMAPGTTITINLIPYGAPNATAAHTTTATLGRNGTFTATFDLSDAPDEALYTIRIPETPRDTPPRRLVTVGNATGASLGATDHESIGTVLYANGVTTTDGGFIVARNNTTTVAVSEYFGPGAASPQPDYTPLLWQNETLTITVYQDSDGDQAFDPDTDEPYQRAGDPVQTTVNVTVDVSERETTQTTSHPTTTQTTTTSTRTTATSTTQSTTEPSTTTTGDSADADSRSDTPIFTPGFGGLATLIALLIAALIVRRE